MAENKKSKLFTLEYIMVLLTTFFAAITHSIFTSIFPLYVNNLGGSNAVVGTMATGMVVAGVITRLFAGRLMDKYGRRSMLIMGSILFSVNTIMYIFFTSTEALYLLRIFNGISQGIYFGAASTIVADIVPKERLIDGMGYFSIAGPLAFSMGPSIGLSIYESMGAQALFIFVSVFSLMGVACTFGIRHSYKPTAENDVVKEEKAGKKGIKISSIIELAVFVPSFIILLFNFGNSAVSNFIASMGIERLIPNITLYFTFNTIATVGIRFIMNKLTKAIGKTRLVILGILFITCGFILIGFSYGITTIIISGLLTGLGAGVITPILSTVVFELVPMERRGVANSTYGLFGDIGTGIGSAAWGFVCVNAGFTATYLLSAAVVFAGAIIYKFFDLKSKKKILQ